MHDIRSLLILFAVPRIGPLKIRALVAQFGSPAAVLSSSAKELIRVQGIDRKLASHIVHRDGTERFADDQLRRINRFGGRIITLWDNEYPELLRRIYDPPPLLFVAGTLDAADHRSLAIVGTRHPSHYGQSVTETFSLELRRIGIPVISGLARGIDTVAHSTVVRSGGRTVAVIGSGLDVPYPPENRKLMERIMENGAVVSEFPMGAKPDASNFPRRNRIISGWSRGTIVIESGDDGGAMITASTALDQNREVFAVPGSITEKKSSGPNRLIRDGRAKLVTCIEDVLCEVDPGGRSPSTTGAPRPLELTVFEQRIFDVLSGDPIHIDTVAESTNTPTSEALVTLLGLEFKGLVRQLPGKLFVKM